MTLYTSEDLSQGWEFKTLRSNTAVFRDPQRFRQVCEEEAQAGWTMLEKLDDRCIRFKRPLQARLNDANLPADVNPYRVQYGRMSYAAFSLTILLFSLGVAAAIMLVVFFVIQRWA